MAISEKDLVDGTTSFRRGMDASEHPSEIAPDGYYKGINVRIPRTGGGITNRGGWHAQQIDWRGSPAGKDIYEQGHIQGTGWYWNGSRVVNIRSVDGFIIELLEDQDGCWKGKILNEGDPNPANRTKAWITTIPYGVIVNDGISTPLIINNSGVRRSDPANGEITAGRMGAYVQNRFFYVNLRGNFIQASDFQNPVSIRNSSATNIHGFLNPQDEYEITAIGRQKALLDTALVGVLSWSDGENIYSADVRGSRESWEELSSNVGKTQQVVPSIGATSSFSFVNFNTNLYFRNQNYGLCDLRQSQAQFARENDFESQSQEVDYWFGNDTPWMLDQCYTVKYKNRLFTTTAGEISKSGHVYWNGLIVCHPNPSNHTIDKSFPRRYEGLYTGIRPWCLTATTPPTFDGQLLADSHDEDEVNRLYKYVDHKDYDLNHLGERIEIESSIETRSYASGYRNEPKKTKHRFYSLGSLRRSLYVHLETRPEGYGAYLSQFKIVHKVKACCSEATANTKAICFRPIPIKQQERKRVQVDSEPENDEKNPDYATSNKHCTRQYKFNFKGGFRLYQFVTVSSATDWDKTPTDQAQEDALTNPYVYLSKGDYSYSIAKENNNEFLDGYPMEVANKPN